jgi:hypothetical protein
VGLRIGPTLAATCLARWPTACSGLARLDATRKRASGPVTGAGAPALALPVGARRWHEHPGSKGVTSGKVVGGRAHQSGVATARRRNRVNAAAFQRLPCLPVVDNDGEKFLGTREEVCTVRHDHIGQGRASSGAHQGGQDSGS